MILTLIICLRNNNLLCNLMQILIKYNMIKYLLNLKFEKNYKQLK